MTPEEPVHPALLQAEQEQAITDRIQRMQDKELAAATRPDLARTVARVAEIERRHFR
jgi:hypothetical protein